MSSLPTPGSLLDGRYRLRFVLGEGAMGTVYEGEDLRLARRVAIKIMRDSLGDETFGERLFREAKAAARAEHPAVVTVYGYGTDDELGVSYVVTERLDGEDLERRIKKSGVLSISLARRVGLEVADALAAVHAAGVIHRDLKPSNIFLATRGLRVDEVKLLDFGVAKHIDLHTLTETGQVFGTPMYMAPEQLADSKHVDPRSDLYALGAVLFECVTGTRPFSAPNIMALANAVLFESVHGIQRLRSDLPEGFAEIIERCLQKRARDRFPNAQALRAALHALPDSAA